MDPFLAWAARMNGLCVFPEFEVQDVNVFVNAKCTAVHGNIDYIVSLLAEGQSMLPSLPSLH